MKKTLFTTIVFLLFLAFFTSQAQRITVKTETVPTPVCSGAQSPSYSLPKVVINEGAVGNFKTDGGFGTTDVAFRLPGGSYEFDIAATPSVILVPDAGGNDITLPALNSDRYSFSGDKKGITIKFNDVAGILALKLDKIEITGLKLSNVGNTGGNIMVVDNGTNGCYEFATGIEFNGTGDLVGTISLASAPPIDIKYYVESTITTPPTFQCVPDPDPGCGSNPCRDNNGRVPICAVQKMLSVAAKIALRGVGIEACPSCGICEICEMTDPGSSTIVLQEIATDVCPGTTIYAKIEVNGAVSATSTLQVNGGGVMNTATCPDGSGGCFTLNNLNNTDQLTANVILGCTFTHQENPPIQNIPVGELKAEDLSNAGTIYDIDLYPSVGAIPADEFAVFGNFDNTKFQFKDGNNPIDEDNYSMTVISASGSITKNSSDGQEAWYLNPSIPTSLTLDLLYTVEFRDLRCGNTPKYFKFKLFDNSPKQLIGITNGGVCRDPAATGDIKIGWIGQGAVGYLSCIEEVNTSANYIQGSLDASYKTRKGIESGFVINRAAINTTSDLSFEVQITYYVCPGSNFPDASLTSCTTGSVSNGQSCIMKTIRERIVISPLPTAQITLLGGGGLAATYCENAPSITLVGIPAGGFGASKSFKVFVLGTNPNTVSPLASPIISFTAGETGALEANKTYTIEYTYKSEYGCESKVQENIEVIQLPAPIVTPNFKFCTSLNPLPNLILPNQLANTTIRWYSASDVPLATVNNDMGYDVDDAALPPDIEREHFFKVAVVNSNGCEGTKTPISVIIAKPPVVDFSATETCQEAGGTTVSFTNHSSTSVLGTGFVLKSVWDFDDNMPNDTIAGLNGVNHVYANPGIYNVRLTVITDANVPCESVIEKKIIVHKNAQLNNGIYVEDFEGAISDWTASTQTEPNGVSKSSSWQVRPITRADGTTGNAYVTVTNNNNPFNVYTYNNSEYSWIESPCFDLSVLSAPLININMRYDTDYKADGVFIMYTTDNGVTWRKLGDVSQGSNWYNGGDVLGFSSVASGINDTRKGWSGKSEDFVEAKLSLSFIKDSIANSPTTPVRFRIVFATNADNPAGLPFTGVAVDRVVILDKNHKVFLEHFTNTTGAEHQDTGWSNFVNDPTAKNDLIYVQYHTTYPTGDAIGQASRPESNARTLHYAVPKPPYTVIDGRTEPGKMLYRNWDWKNTNSIAYNYYLQRSLEATKFNFGNATFAGGTGGQPLKISVDVIRTSAPADMKNSMIAHVMIVEDVVQGTYKNVVRKMLPNPAGTRMEGAWANGEIRKLEASWQPKNAAAANTYSMVVFIADELTKEIYQVEKYPINQAVETSTAGKMVTLSAEEINLYPNPTSSDITIVLPETPKEKVVWRMYDALGREVEGGSGISDNAIFRINTQNCNKGIYIVELATSEWKVRKSVSVIK